MNRQLHKALCTAALFLSLTCTLTGQDKGHLRFAFMTDLHLSEGSDRFRQLGFCIDRINADDSVNFTLLGGDITDFGADSEILAAKKELDRLSGPYYIVAGNHDAKWSESGCNTFAKVFGYEHFAFVAGGVKFVGFNCGPNLRMAPAMVPHETLVWLDSTIRTTPATMPVIALNHYPQDTMSLNYFKVINILKEGNIQMLIGGHRHIRKTLATDGIPYVLGCSLEKRDKGAKLSRTTYYTFDIENAKLSATEHRFIIDGQDFKAEEPETFFSMDFSEAPRYTPAEGSDDRFFLPADFPWMKYEDNAVYPQVRTVWEVQDENDIGCGALAADGLVVYANESGSIKAIREKDGMPVWSYTTGGKVFSTPALTGRGRGARVITGSCDGGIYCLRLRDGKPLWRYSCRKSVLATAATGRCKGRQAAFCGSSDGSFRAIDVRTGKLLWSFDGVRGFVECRPLADAEQIVFGDWANTLYSLDPDTGELQWTWHTSGSRMYSPAAVNPVKASGRIYFSTPERITYCLDARTGKELWKASGGRENAVLSPDGSRLYVKTMFNTLNSFDTGTGDCRRLWEAETGAFYDIAPTPCAVSGEHIFVPTDKGNVFCLSSEDGRLLWKHKVSTGLINSILPLDGNRLLISTMDGIITIIRY